MKRAAARVAKITYFLDFRQLTSLLTAALFSLQLATIRLCRREQLQSANKQEILCEQRLNYILMIQKKLNSTVTADNQRLLLANCRQQQQQQSVPPLANATTSTRHSTAPTASNNRSTNAHTNSTCPKEAPAAEPRPSSPSPSAAANERWPEFNVNQSAAGAAELLLAAASHGSGNSSGHHAGRAAQPTGELHFGAKVAL